MLGDRLAAYRQASMTELIGVLLKQLRRPLAANGPTLSDADCEALAERIAGRTITPDDSWLIPTLTAIVRESLDVLAGWGLDYARSLTTDLSTMSGWTTTAEFLEIATEKTNAELRISTAACVLVAAGDRVFIDVLETLAARIPAPDDLDAQLERLIAERILKWGS